MRSLFIIPFAIIVLYSCRKDKITTENKVYNIVEIAIDSNKIINSIDSFIPHGSGCGYVQYPTDSSDVDSLDLDMDGFIDSYLYAKSWYNFVSASYPCVNYCHSIGLSSVDTFTQFTKELPYNQAALFDESTIIDTNCSWDYSVMLALSVPLAPFSCSYTGLHYIGYRRKTNLGYNYGWLKVESYDYGVRILEAAINKTYDMGIPAGKKVN